MAFVDQSPETDLALRSGRPVPAAALVASLALLVGIGWGVGAIATLWQTPPAVTALAEIVQAGFDDRAIATAHSIGQRQAGMA